MFKPGSRRGAELDGGATAGAVEGSGWLEGDKLDTGSDPDPAASSS